MEKTIRLQKFLAHQGIGSRRSIEKIINAHRVSINDQFVSKQGIKIIPCKDIVAIDNKVIKFQAELAYFFLNKPPGVISSRLSEQGETTVIDLINTNKRIYPAGRLDKDSQGLILLTNDGELTHRLTHPKYAVDKTYQVTIMGKITEKKLEKLRNGVVLAEGITAKAKITAKNNTLTFIIHQGFNRQIRRMCAVVNLTVTQLTRTAIGPIKLGKLILGHSRKATDTEITTLKHMVGL